MALILNALFISFNLAYSFVWSKKHIKDVDQMFLKMFRSQL